MGKEVKKVVKSVSKSVSNVGKGIGVGINNTARVVGNAGSQFLKDPLNPSKALGLQGTALGDVMDVGLTGGAGGRYGTLGERGALNTAVSATGEAFGHISGANAMRKSLMDQQSANRAEVVRQANISDALARNSGSDAASIFLGSDTGRRKRGAAKGGSSGTQSSTGTGTQNF